MSGKYKKKDWWKGQRRRLIYVYVYKRRRKVDDIWRINRYDDIWSKRQEWQYNTRLLFDHAIGDDKSFLSFFLFLFFLTRRLTSSLFFNSLTSNIMDKRLSFLPSFLSCFVFLSVCHKIRDTAINKHRLRRQLWTPIEREKRVSESPTK